MDDIQQKIAAIKQELNHHPDDASLLNELGVGHHLLGEYEKAQKQFLRAATLAPGDHQIQFNLAKNFEALQQFEQAQHHYMNAIDLQPDYVPALNNLADICEQLDDVARAQELFEYIIKINPNEAVGYLNLGNFYLRRNDTVAAGRQYQKAIARDDACYEAYYNIGFILKHVDQFNEAIPYFEQCLEINPTFEAARHDLQICEQEVKSEK